MSCEGRIAIVTGSSSGIGQAIATTLALQGCSVALAARRIEGKDKYTNIYNLHTHTSEIPLRLEPLDNKTDSRRRECLADEVVLASIVHSDDVVDVEYEERDGRVGFDALKETLPVRVLLVFEVFDVLCEKEVPLPCGLG